MKLFYSPGACSLSPHIVACEAELPIELIKVDLQSKLTESGEDFRKINPNGYVPVLMLDDGKQLSEGPAIVQYLADHASEKKLAPEAGTFERYLLQQWLNYIASEIHKSFSPLFDASASQEVKNSAVDRLLRRLETVAVHLAQHPYLLGKVFSVADVYLFVTLTWGQYVGLDINQWPALTRYKDKISSRPAVQQALKEEGLA